ncbi:MAG: hypothetical protein ABR582_17765, partial [Gemmatimonadaceae bacterium]
FYAFPNVEGLMRKLGVADDLALSDQLLQKSLVAVVPGSAFGAPGQGVQEPPHVSGLSSDAHWAPQRW